MRVFFRYPGYLKNEKFFLQRKFFFRSKNENEFSSEKLLQILDKNSEYQKILSKYRKIFSLSHSLGLCWHYARSLLTLFTHMRRPQACGGLEAKRLLDAPFRGRLSDASRAPARVLSRAGVIWQEGFGDVGPGLRCASVATHIARAGWSKYAPFGAIVGVLEHVHHRIKGGL